MEAKMKMKKIMSILLALLLAAMVIVPMVSAETNSISSQEKTQGPTIDVKNIQLPELQFDPSQKMVVVNNGLNPDQNTETSEFSDTFSKTQSDVVTSVPFGSIIYHSDKGITSVFDSTGKQLFAVDDSKAAQVFTPHGSQTATFVHEVPEGSFINTQGNTKYTIYKDQIILTEITEKAAADSNSRLLSTWPPQYIEGVEYTPTQALGRFVSQWTVPTAPPSTGSNQITTIWNGLHRTTGSDGVLQPVLAWNENGNQKYTIRIWEVTSGGTYKSTQYGARVGHTIIGDMTWDASMGYWKATIKDVNSGDTSPMWSNLVSPSSCEIALMLEGYDMSAHQNFYPGAITFRNNELRSTSGAVITPPASSVTGRIASSWLNVNPNLNVNINGWPGSVILSTGN
jgi:hypothetical protein